MNRMKAVCLALLLANVLSFAWSRWHGSGVTPSGGTSVFSEDSRSGGGRGVQPASAYASEASADLTRCVSIGPFADADRANEVASSLRLRHGVQLRLRQAQGEAWGGFWVRLQGIPSRAEARRIVRLLMEQGVADAYVLPATGDGYDISLGIFTGRTRAERLAAQVQALGYTPTVVDHARTVAVQWLDIRRNAGKSDLISGDLIPGELIQSAREPGSGILNLEMKACPQ